MYICLCNALTDRKVKQAVTEAGTLRPGEVYAACGCRAQCGQCVKAVLALVQRWCSAKIGEGLIFDLRTQVFDHVQRLPIAFFSRAQTGALVSRLNSDVQGAQQAFTSTLQSIVGNVATTVTVLVRCSCSRGSSRPSRWCWCPSSSSPRALLAGVSRTSRASATS